MSHRLALAALALGLAALAAACSGEDKRTLPTPGITVVGGQTGVAPLVTPFPTPRISGNEVDSSASKGYTATFPEGWTFYPNRIQTKDGSADIIFAPLTAGAQAQASISVLCIVKQQPTPEEHVAFEATKVARVGTNTNIQMTQRQVSDVSAAVISYRFDSPNEANIPPLEKQDVLFTAGSCDWQITTTAPDGERARYDPLFTAFLDSFRVVAP